MRVSNKKHSFIERLVPDELPWYHRKMYQDHAERYIFAKKYVVNKKVLDIACGVGYGSLMLAEAGASSVVGIDLSAGAIEYAKKKYFHQDVRYLVGDASDIPIKNNSIDVVVSLETLEHVKNYKRFIEEIKRVLKKNGTLVISTPNVMLGTELDNPFHTKELTLEDFEEVLNKNFYEVEIFGQKPILTWYLRFVGKIIPLIPRGNLRWFIGTCLKYFFRGSKIIPLRKFKIGFVPSVFVGVGRNRAVK